MQTDLSADQVLDKMAKYCAYQERCLSDVKNKLRDFDLPANAKQEILDYLIDNKFVDDSRFAKAFVRGKLNQNGWGVNKIRFNLLKKGIDKEIISEALSIVDGDGYKERLLHILQNKKIKAQNEYQARQKLVAYAIQKGFEPSVAWDVVNSMKITFDNKED